MPKGLKRKKGKGKALVPPVLEPVDSELAQEKVDKATNVKHKKKKIITAFTEQQKEEISKFLMQNEILYSKRLAGFKGVVDIPVAVSSWLIRHRNRSEHPSNNRYTSQQSASVLGARITTHRHVQHLVVTDRGHLSL